MEEASPPNGRTDEVLFVRFRDGLDESAFRILMERYFDRAFAFARGMLTDPLAAEDAVQETFLRTIRARAGYDPNRPFRIWFYHILRNCCIDELRRRGAAPRLSEEPEALEPGRLAPSDPDRIDSDEIVSHIERLPEIMREALMLRFWSGLTLEEVGRTLGCSAEAAKKRVQRALKQLRDSMSPSRDPAVYALGGDKTGGKPGRTEGS
jgi:RNA polymerase sigma-70 factor (ECF subfamily)